MGLNIGSTAASGLYVGSTPARGMYIGSKLVYPPPMSYQTNFKFGQTSETEISTASNYSWSVAKAGAVYPVVNAYGTFYTVATGSDATYTPYAYLAQPLNKYEVSVSITIQDDLNSYKSGIIIGKPGTGDSYAELGVSSGWCWLTKGTSPDGRGGWNLSSLVTPVKGDTLTLSRDRDGSSTRFRIYVNGILKATCQGAGWGDATNANFRNYVGLFVQYRRSQFQNYWGARVNGFEAHTY